MVVSGKLITFVPRFCNFTFKIMNSIESAKGEIVMYQPDETIRLEVRMGEDTVWLSQQQMAELFQRDQSVIARHIRNIYKEEELTEEGTYAKFAYMGHDGLQKYEVWAQRCQEPLRPHLCAHYKEASISLVYVPQAISGFPEYNAFPPLGFLRQSSYSLLIHLSTRHP